MALRLIGPKTFAEEVGKRSTGLESFKITHINWGKTLKGAAKITAAMLAITGTGGAASAAISGGLVSDATMKAADELAAAKETIEEYEATGRQIPERLEEEAAVIADIKTKASLGDLDAQGALNTLDQVSELRESAGTPRGVPTSEKKVLSGAYAAGAQLIKKITGKDVPRTPTSKDPWAGMGSVKMTRVVGPTQPKLPKGRWTEKQFASYARWYIAKYPARDLTRKWNSAAKGAYGYLNKMRASHKLKRVSHIKDMRYIIKYGKFPSKQVAKTRAEVEKTFEIQTRTPWEKFYDWFLHGTKF